MPNEKSLKTVEEVLDQIRGKAIPCPEFCQLAYQALESVSKSDYRLRKGKGVKELFEEVLPLVAFVKHVERPGRKVLVQYAGGNHPFDGEIYFAGIEVENGSLDPHFHIEITQADSPVEYLKREALEKNGSLHGGENIEQVGSRHKGSHEIISHPVAEYGQADISRITEWCVKAIGKKVQKEYPSPSILLVKVSSLRPLSPPEWSEVVVGVADEATRGKFAGVFLVHPWENIVLPAWKKQDSVISLDGYSSGALGLHSAG